MTTENTALKVDVIIPVYNAEKYLDRCYKSLKNQTLEGIRIIFVDDESTDNSGKICDKYAADNPMVTVIHQKNAGAGYARNRGLEVVEAEYVAFVDADDSVEPEMYEALYKAAREYDADFVLSGAKYVGGLFFDADADEYKTCFSKCEIFAGEDGRKKLALGIAGALPEEEEDSRYGFAVWKNLYRSAIIKDNNIRFLSEREYESEDALFLIDYTEHIQKAVGIPGAYYNYFRNPNSFSKSFESNKFKRYKAFISELEKHLAEFIPKNDYEIFLDRQLQAVARVSCIHEAMLGGKGTCSRLLAIDKDADLTECLKRYPWWKLPKKQAIFAGFMRYRLTLLQYILVRLKSKMN